MRSEMSIYLSISLSILEERREDGCSSVRLGKENRGPAAILPALLAWLAGDGDGDGVRSVKA